MAFGDTIGTPVKGTGTVGEASVTFSSPTSGNLLVFTVGRSAIHTGGGASWGTITDWTIIRESNISGAVGGIMFAKISNGTETTVTTAGTGTQGNWQSTGAQYEGPFDPSFLDVSAEDETHLGSATTSQSTGTTGSTSQNDTLAIALFAAARLDFVNTSRLYSNSFSEVVIADGASARATSIQAKKVLSATGTVECTYSFTDTGDEMYGCVGVFKKLVVAIIPPKNVFMNQAMERSNL